MTTAVYWPGRFIAADRKGNGGVYNGYTDSQKLMEFTNSRGDPEYKAYFVRAGAISEFKLYETQMSSLLDKLVGFDVGSKKFVEVIEEIKDLVWKYEDRTQMEFILVFEKGFPKSLNYPDHFALHAHKDYAQFIEDRNRPIGIGSGYQFALGFLSALENEIKDDAVAVLDSMFHGVSILDSGTGEEYDVRFF